MKKRTISRRAILSRLARTRSSRRAIRACDSRATNARSRDGDRGRRRRRARESPLADFFTRVFASSPFRDRDDDDDDTIRRRHDTMTIRTKQNSRPRRRTTARVSSRPPSRVSASRADAIHSSDTVHVSDTIHLSDDLFILKNIFDRSIVVVAPHTRARSPSRATDRAETRVFSTRASTSIARALEETRRVHLILGGRIDPRHHHDARARAGTRGRSPERRESRERSSSSTSLDVRARERDARWTIGDARARDRRRRIETRRRERRERGGGRERGVARGDLDRVRHRSTHASDRGDVGGEG